MKQTHFEMMEALIAPYRAEARRLVDKHGWQAYPFLIQQQLGRPNIRPGEINELTGGTSAVMHEIVLRAIQKSRTPFAFWRLEDQDEDLRYLEAWMSAGPVNMKKHMPVIMNQACQEAAHEFSGKHVFDVSPGLGQRLVNTELRGLKTDDLRLPFPNIYLLVPRSTGIEVYNNETGWHPCAGFYVTEADETDQGPRCWRMMICGESKNPREPWDDALFYFHVPLPDGMTLEDAIAQEVLRYPSKAAQSGDIECYKNTWHIFFKFALNAVIYSTWPDAEKTEELNPTYHRLEGQLTKHPKNSRKHERVLEKMRGVDPQRRIILGRSVPKWEEPEQGAPGTGTPLSVRTLVQGHWQRFHVGEGRKDTKWKFREPFWRGPVGAEVEGPRHVLV